MGRGPRDAHPSPRGDGNITQVIVQIEQITAGIAYTIDEGGLPRSVRMVAQRAKGANPVVGEWWIIDRTLSGEWSFATILERVVPSVASVPDLFGAMETAGFIANGYVPPANPASGVSFTSTGLAVLSGTTNVQAALEATDAALAARATTAAMDALPTWPESFRLSYMDYPKTQEGWPYNANAPNPPISHGGGYYVSGGGPTPADLTFEVPMLAGTWRTLLHYTKGPDLGKMILVVDGVESAEIDCYQPTSHSSQFVIPHSNLVIATSGVKTVIIRKLGFKDAFSADFFCLWSSVSGVIL